MGILLEFYEGDSPGGSLIVGNFPGGSVSGGSKYFL